jgi:heat-inducible transcriptional repressor
MHNRGVSPATVRNDMGGLEEDGYILRPHTSAGGIPSDKGYRFAVEKLPFGQRPSAGDASRLRRELGRVPLDIDEWTEAASSVVAALLNALAFATPPRSEASTIKGIELLQLQELAVMLVVVLREMSIFKQFIPLDRPTTPEALQARRNRLSEMLAGKTAQQIEAYRASTSDALDIEVIESTLAALRKLEAAWVRDSAIQGLSHLLDQPEFAVQPEQARHVLGAIEDSETLVELARAARDDGTATVMIGAENPRASLRSLSVVLCQYGVPGEARGVLGLIGPTRMAYGRTLPVVHHAALLLSGLVARLYGIAEMEISEADRA